MVSNGEIKIPKGERFSGAASVILPPPTVIVLGVGVNIGLGIVVAVGTCVTIGVKVVVTKAKAGGLVGAGVGVDCVNALATGTWSLVPDGAPKSCTIIVVSAPPRLPSTTPIPISL